MTELRKNKTLFEAVPALGAISAHSIGKAKMMPVGFEHPGFVLVDGANRIGRDPAQNPHVILSSHVSRCHCEVMLSQGKITVRDLNSHNGTYLNDVRITEQEAKPGDKIGLSRRVTFVLVMDTELVKPIGVEVNMAEGGEATVQGLSPQDIAKAKAEAAALRAGDKGTAAPIQPIRTPVFDPSMLGAVGDAPDGERPPAPEPEAPAPTPGPAAKPAPIMPKPVAPAPVASLQSAADDGEPDPSQQIRQLEQQRNVLATLYQITLHCLATESHKEAEKLLTNVLQRLVPMDAGFILYQLGSTWRASICPSTTRRPADASVRAAYRLVLEAKGPLVVRDPPSLLALGLEQGSALVVPMRFNDMVCGVVGALSTDPQAYTPEMVEIVAQVATVAAAALRER
jgi:hypothetical protein